MLQTSSLKLSVGDRVVYPNQGLCKVTAINSSEVAGQRLTFITLIKEEDGAKVMVPEAKVVAIGVRKLASPDDVAKVFAFLKSDSDKASLDWKARARSNVERMATGGLIGLAEVVKGLQVLSELRPLPTKERELYFDARHLFVSELAAAMGLTATDAEDAIDVVLFPPGKERPKRTAEEFKALAGEGDDLGMEGDLLGLDGGAEEPEEPEADPEASEEGGDDDEEGGKKKPAKGDKPGKKAAAPEAPKRRSLISDIDVTEPAGPALLATLPEKKKRGRPPKVRPELAAAIAAVTAPPAAPKPPPPAPVAKAAPPEKKAPPVVEKKSPAKAAAPEKKGAAKSESAKKAKAPAAPAKKKKK